MQIQVYPQPRNLWENSFKLIFEFSEDEKKEKDFWLAVWRIKRHSCLRVIMNDMMNLALGGASLSVRFPYSQIDRVNKELIPFVEDMRLWDEEK